MRAALLLLLLSCGADPVLLASSQESATGCASLHHCQETSWAWTLTCHDAFGFGDRCEWTSRMTQPECSISPGAGHPCTIDTCPSPVILDGPPAAIATYCEQALLGKLHR